jgi:UDP-N-acetylmuramate--alanine ligase
MNQLSPKQLGERLETAAGTATIYFVGIGGCGMSGLAHLMLDAGFTVAGSDLADNAETCQLRERGATVHLGHTAAQLQSARPFLVVYTPAIRRDNAELEAAERLGVPIVRRAVLLAALMRWQRGICVAGMHGKTTTSAWLAYALGRLTPEPSHAVGAAVPQLARHAKLSGTGIIARDLATGAPARPLSDHPPVPSPAGFRPPDADRWFVAETDESDGTLPLFEPEHAIVLNVDEEHLDYYANLEAICADFKTFGDQTRGTLVYCADDPNLVRLFAGRDRAVSYGFNPAAGYRIEWPASPRPQSLTGERMTVFEVWLGRTCLGTFTTRLAGEKNVSNAAAVVALLHRMGRAPGEIARAIAPFTGAARRQEVLFADKRFTVLDDYGHHPQEIRATLRALKEGGEGRLLVAFQPHRYTRTRALLQQFATSFREADRLWLTEVYAASEDEIPGANGAALAGAVRATGQAAEFVPCVDDLVAAVHAAMQPGDRVLFLGAGDITRAAHGLAATLCEERTAMKDSFYRELQAALSATAVVRRDEPMSRRTTLRVGGPADFYVEPANEDDLRAVLRLCAGREIGWRLLGRGSNLLVRDGGFRGVILSLAQARFSRIEAEPDNRLRCGAGAKLKDVAQVAKKQGLGGLEFLEGIPGTIGGALRMNAGAMGASTFEAVESVRFMDREGGVHERAAGEVEFHYRNCPLFKEHIALGAVLRGVPAAAGQIQKRLDECAQKRWSSQPKQASAGCMFKNPAAMPAGRLIDELGLKGLRVGGAVVSDAHGNFLVNDGGASARDVLELIELVRARVREARGVELHTEVEIIGEDDLGR